jgi:protein ImuA
LMRVKAGECAEFIVGACDATGRIHLFPPSRDREDQARRWGGRAVG